MGDRPLTTRTQRVLVLADEAAARVGREYIGTEHVLIGLLEEKMGAAAQLLNHLGVTAESVRTAWQQQVGTPL